MSASLADLGPYLAAAAAAVGWAITYGRQSQRLDTLEARTTKEHDALAADFKAHREESIRKTAHAEGVTDARAEHAAQVAARVERLEAGRADVDKQLATILAVTSERSARMLDLLREIEKIENSIEQVESTIIVKVGALDGRVSAMGGDVRSLMEWKAGVDRRSNQHSVEMAAIKDEVRDGAPVERKADRGGGSEGRGRYVGPDVSLSGDERPSDEGKRKR